MFYSILIGLCFTFYNSNLLAQENEEAKTLIKSKNLISTENLGFFIAPSYGITQMDGASVSLFNLRGGVSINRKFALGAYFNTSMNQINPESETVPNIYMDYWTTGGFLEYTVLSRNIFHFSFPLYVGYGEVQMDNESGDAGLGESTFFQIEPSALLEINLHKNVRFNIGLGYRFIGEMNYRNFNQSELAGLTGYAGLKIGLFK